jgi:hypothetical protein
MPKPRPRPLSDKLPKSDPRYQPTPEELNEDLRIDASPEQIAAALFGRSA